MPLPYFDAHTHAHFAAFENDWREVMDRALAANVWLLNVGTQRDTSRKAVEVAQEYKEGVYAAVGLHPVHTSRSFHDVQELGGLDPQGRPAGQALPGNFPGAGFTSRGEEFDHDHYLELGRDPKVVAIGECGLDYYRLESGILNLESEREEIAVKKERQEVAFKAQIELANKLNKPLMIHCRDAFQDLIQILDSKFQILADPPGVIHFMTGTVADAAKLLELGFAFTFGGVVTFTRDYDEVIRTIPPDRILSETDAPYVAPAPYRGKRNEPAYVVETVKKLAELKDMSTDAMREQIFENAARIFGIVKNAG